MSFQIDAIYDGGVLKPLQPIDLVDQTHVTLIVEPAAKSDDAVVVAQQAALKKLWQELDSLPPVNNNDGWSVRDHDQLLYGQP